MKRIKLLVIASVFIVALAVACNNAARVTGSEINASGGDGGGKVTIITNDNGTTVTNVVIEQDKGIEQFEGMVFQSYKKYDEVVYGSADEEDNIYFHLKIQDGIIYTTGPRDNISFNSDYTTLPLMASYKGGLYYFSGKNNSAGRNLQQAGHVKLETNGNLTLTFTEFETPTSETSRFTSLKGKTIEFYLFDYTNK